MTTTNMKCLRISEVMNGWIVTDISDVDYVSTESAPHVFNNLDCMLAFLAQHLGHRDFPKCSTEKVS